MEEQFKHIDKLTSHLIKDAGMHKPSTDFFSKVMQAVENKAIKQPYEPLISRFSWFIICAIFIASVVILYFNVASEPSLFRDFNYLDKIQFKNPLAGIKFSKTLVYGIGFLGLFIAQIPFLKRYMEKGYR